METHKTIYQQKIKELNKELNNINSELKRNDERFKTLRDKYAYHRSDILECIKIDIRKIHAETILKAGRYRKGKKKITHRYRGVVRVMIGLKKRKIELKKRKEDIWFIKRNYKFYSVLTMAYFNEFINEVLRGVPYMPLGHGLRFTAGVATIDNSDGIKRVNKYETMMKAKRLVEEGKPLQNKLLGQDGEKFIVFHDNKVRLTNLSFNKIGCNVPNIRYYTFIPTQHVPMEGKRKKYDDYKLNNVEDILNGNFSTRMKMRLIDRRFPEHRDNNYREEMQYD